MSAIYLAARYGRREELCGCADDLRARGHIITSRWLTGAHDATVGRGMEDTDALEERRRWAEEDWADLSAAGIVIAFTEGPAGSPGRARGGRHVEMGLALAWAKRTIVVGPVENVFYALAAVERYETWADLLASVEREMAWARSAEVR